MIELGTFKLTSPDGSEHECKNVEVPASRATRPERRHGDSSVRLRRWLWQHTTYNRRGQIIDQSIRSAHPIRTDREGLPRSKSYKAVYGRMARHLRASASS